MPTELLEHIAHSKPETPATGPDLPPLPRAPGGKIPADATALERKAWADLAEEATDAVAAFFAGPSTLPDPDLEESEDAVAPTEPAPPEPQPPAQTTVVPVKAKPTEPTPPDAYHLPMKRYDGRTWYHFYGIGQPPRGAKEVDWSTFWFTYEAPSPREDSSPPPLAADASDACGPPSQPRYQHGPLPMSCFEDGRECIVRDDNNSIMIHSLDYELIKSQAVQGIIGSKFMLDSESFSIFSGPYPFDNPPSLSEPADGPAPGNRAADDGRTDADTDLLGLLSDKGDAHEPRRSAFRDPAHRTSSFAPLPAADRLPPCPRLCIPEPPDRRYRGCTIVPSICLPDTFRIAQEDTRLLYMDHNRRLRCARPCSTQPFCPWGLVCAQNVDDPDADRHDRHQCSRCHEFDRHRESPWGHFARP